MSTDPVWYQQIGMPHHYRSVIKHPWRYAGGTLVTNGSMAVLLPASRAYPQINEQHAKILDALFAPTSKPRKTTVEALRNWAGDFVFTRCTRCQGEGYIPCPDCTEGCNKCDDEREVECPICKTAGWIGFDCESRGELGGTVINLKLLAGIVNCVEPGDVEIYTPERVDEYGAQKPLLIIGKTWKGIIMPMRNSDGVLFKGWAG